MIIVIIHSLPNVIETKLNKGTSHFFQLSSHYRHGLFKRQHSAPSFIEHARHPGELVSLLYLKLHLAMYDNFTICSNHCTLGFFHHTPSLYIYVHKQKMDNTECPFPISYCRFIHRGLPHLSPISPNSRLPCIKFCAYFSVI